MTALKFVAVKRIDGGLVYLTEDGKSTPFPELARSIMPGERVPAGWKVRTVTYDFHENKSGSPS